jgi:chromosome segregation ATPase
MSTIAEAKTEVQKLIPYYNQLKTEAKNSETAAVAAEKLAKQIKAMQQALSRLQNPNQADLTQDLRQAEAEKVALEARIAQIEYEQQQAREQINHLSQAKLELKRLKGQVEDNLLERESLNENLQIQLEQLMHKTETEQQQFKEQLETIRKQAEKDTEVLRIQRDTARAQQKMEQEKLEAYQAQQGGRLKWLMLGLITGLVLGIGGLVALGAFTPVLEGFITVHLS